MMTQTIHDYLSLQGIRINNMRIKNLYSEHPMPHSIRSISDTLDALHVPNMVCNLEFSQLCEIEGAFMIVFGKSEYPFFIVEYIDYDKQKVYVRDYGKSVAIDIELFKQLWTGVVLMAYKSKQTIEDSFLSYNVGQAFSMLHNNMRWWLPLMSIVLLCTYAIIQTPNLWYTLPKIAGIFVSYIIVMRSFGETHLLNGICHIGKQINCDDVFKSDDTKLFNVFPLGDLSLIYFASTLMCICLGVPINSLLFATITSTTILFVIYSIGWQVAHHKWCTLCLIIDVILMIDLYVSIQHIVSGNIEYKSSLTHFLIFGGLMLGGLFMIRELVYSSESILHIKKLRLKYEQLLNCPNLFWEQMSQQEKMSILDQKMVISNNIIAEQEITIIMNPFCSKCGTVHKQISSFCDYRINLIILSGQDERTKEIALKMISYALLNSWDSILEMIDIWYKTKQLPDDITILEQAQNILNYNIRYCKENNITGTPFVAINNKRIPAIYNIEDLVYIL